jgi:ABC-type multidrug transport system ATPase subunit
MKIIAGVEKPEQGSVFINGLDLWTREIEARQLITYVPEHPDVTPYASIEEVLLLVCRLREVPLQQAQDVARRAGLHAYRKRSIRELSQGQRRRVLMAAAWIGSPRVLVLDEPLEAMDRRIRHEIQSWVRHNVELQNTIVLSTHDVDDFAELASAAVSVRHGSIQLWDALPEDSATRYSFLADVAGGAKFQARAE